MADDNELASTRRDFREIAREEARAVYEELGAVDADGQKWTLRGLMENFNVDRRTALQAIGLIAVGYAAPTAVLHAVSGTAQAAATGQEGTAASPLQTVFTNGLDHGNGVNSVGMDGPLTLNHNAISSATTITAAQVVPFDTSVSGFTITIGNELQEDGMVLWFIDKGGSADTKTATLDPEGATTIDGSATLDIDASDTITKASWDGSEWKTAIFAQSVDIGSGTVDGSKDIPGIPATSSDPGPSFDTWQQISSSRPGFVSIEAQAETNGTTAAWIQLEVDESGGTTADYTIRFVSADESMGSGQARRNMGSFLIPAGAQYQIVNDSDPNNANTINDVREFTL